MSSKARVLIVDPSRESREILRTLLNRHGTETLETARVDEASTITELQQPDLIVCDADGDSSHASEATRKLTRQASRSAIPIVVLGTVKRDFGAQPPGEQVPKPYHYGPLIRKIEELLGNRG